MRAQGRVTWAQRVAAVSPDNAVWRGEPLWMVDLVQEYSFEIKKSYDMTKWSFFSVV